MKNSVTPSEKSPLIRFQKKMNSLMQKIDDELPWKDFDMNEFTPKVEIKEKDMKYIVKAEMPDIDQKDLDISMVNNNLILKGERKSEKEEEEKGRYFSEFSYGSFYRSIPFSEERNPETIKASCKNGVLRVELDKMHKSTNQKQIKINYQ